MSSRSQFFSILSEVFFSAVVGGFLLTLTYFSWRYSLQVTKQQVEDRLDEKTNIVIQTLQKRMDIYTNLLNDSRALYMASDTVTREEWRTFVDNLHLKERDPGVNSLVYIPRVPLTEKASFIEQARSEASGSSYAYLQNFTIFPDEQKSDYFPIFYVEPVTENTGKALGYDHSSEPIRNRALELARDTGTAQITGTIQALTTRKNSFFMYIPLYEGKSVPQTVEQKRQFLKGYIFAGFTNETIFPNILQDALIDENISISFFDGEEVKQDSLLYEKPGSFDQHGALSRVLTINVAGRPWTLRIIAPKNYGIDTLQQKTPRNVAISGVVVSVFAFGFVYLLLSSRRRAVNMADKITGDLKVSEEKYRTIFESFQDVYYQTDITGKILIVSPSIERWVGLTPEQIVGQNATDFYPDPNQRQEMLKKLMAERQINDFEIDLRGKGDSLIKVSVSSKLIFDEIGKPVRIEGILRDITDRKIVEREVEIKNEELERLNKIMTGRELKMIELKQELEAARKV